MTITVTRRQTAREEIDLAVHLLFTGGSLISANLLTWAATDVLKGVAKSKGIPIVADRMVTFIKPEKVKTFFNAIKAHYNFAKHADTDPDKTMKMNPTAVEFSLFNAIVDYGSVYDAHTVPMLLFKAYFLANRPEMFNGKAKQEIEGSLMVFGPAPSLSAAGEVYADYIAKKEGYVRDFIAHGMIDIEL